MTLVGIRRCARARAVGCCPAPATTLRYFCCNLALHLGLLVLVCSLREMKQNRHHCRGEGAPVQFYDVVLVRASTEPHSCANPTPNSKERRSVIHQHTRGLSYLQCSAGTTSSLQGSVRCCTCGAACCFDDWTGTSDPAVHESICGPDHNCRQLVS